MTKPTQQSLPTTLYGQGRGTHQAAVRGRPTRAARLRPGSLLLALHLFTTSWALAQPTATTDLTTATPRSAPAPAPGPPAPAGSAGFTAAGPAAAEPAAERIQLEPLNDPVIDIRTSSKREAGEWILRLGDTLTIELAPGGVDRLRARAKAKRQDIGLFLDGFYLKGIEPRRDSTNPDCLIFVPTYKEVDKPAWSEIFLYPENIRDRLLVSVGFPDGEMARSEFRVHLYILPPWQVLMSVLLALLLLGGLYYVGKYTCMLRDGIGITGASTNMEERTFSLGRTQMAWWTALVLWAFLFLYLFTGSVQLTQSVVILIGLGAGTALGAIAIDKTKNGRQVQPQVDQILDTEVQVMESWSAVNSEEAVITKRQQLIHSIGRDTPPPPTSRGLLVDLLSDAHGVSLARVQIFLWTLVLSVVFVHSVLTKLGMPDFDNTLLTLMGVSSGTYLGFKIPESPPGRT